MLSRLRWTGAMSAASLVALACGRPPDAGPGAAPAEPLPAWLLDRQGLGAVVSVVLPDGRRVVKPMDGKSGYLSQSALPLYFGLGASATAAQVEVRWPSGKRQVVSGPIQAGQLLEIVEP